MSLLNTNIQDLAESAGSSSANYTPSNGLHNAVVIALHDLGLQEQTNDKGEVYEIHKMDLIFAIEEQNSKAEHMIVRRTVSITMGEKSILRKIITDAEWDIREIGDLLGKTCQVLTKVVKTKAGKDFPKVENVMSGKGFKSSGAVKLPYWYADTDGIHSLDGIKIGEKNVREAKVEHKKVPSENSEKASPF